MIRSSNKSIFVILTGFLLLFSMVARSQDKKLTFGLGAGATYSTFMTPSARFEDAADFGAEYARRTSWYAEGIVNIALVKDLSLQTGLKFIGKGAAHKEFKPGSYGYNEGGERLFMMEVPLFAMATAKVGNRDLKLGGGVYFAYMLSGMRKYEVPDFWGVLTEPLYVDLYKRQEMGVGFKAEYGLLQHLNVVAGYEIGLTNLIKGEDSGDARNSTLTLGLGYNF